MRLISDLKTIKEFEIKLLSIVTSDMYDLHASYLEKEGWVGVPTEEHPYYIYIEDESFYNDSFFEEEKYITSFVEALKEMGYQSLYSLSSISLPDPDFCLELDLTKEDISNFDYEYRLSYSVLFPKDYSFVILYVYDYSIVAGKKEFVEGLIGCALETAMNVFKKALNPDWSKQMIRIYEKYKAHNEKILRKLGEA